jgi:aldehyde:ferredoxin oxidoreductase
MRVLRKYREEQYESLVDAVYKRRGWNNNGVPTTGFLQKIGMDLPEVIDVVKNYQ